MSLKSENKRNAFITLAAWFDPSYAEDAANPDEYSF